MEYRKEIKDLLSQKKSWKEISRLVELSDEELTAIACGTMEYQSGEEPCHALGDEVLFFVDEEEYYLGKVAKILPKRGELFPEYEYVITWQDGLNETLWEQQVTNYKNELKRNSWLF